MKNNNEFIINDMKLASSLTNELTILLQAKDTDSIRAIVSNIDEETLKRVKKLLRVKELNLLSSILKAYPSQKSDLFKNKFDLIMKKISLKEIDSKAQATIAICATLSTEQIEEFSKLHPDMTSILLTSIQPGQLKDFLDNQSVINMANVLSIKETRGFSSDFSEAIDNFALSKQESLFQENLQDMTKSLSLEAEQQIYNKLKKENKTDLIKNLSTSAFPKFLVPHLPTEDLKQITKKFELELTISFLNSIADENLFNFWLDITSESGTQRRELINSEINKESEPKQKTQEYYVKIISSLHQDNIEKNKNLIIENFIKTTDGE